VDHLDVSQEEKDYYYAVMCNPKNALSDLYDSNGYIDDTKAKNGTNGNHT